MGGELAGEEARRRLVDRGKALLRLGSEAGGRKHECKDEAAEHCEARYDVGLSSVEPDAVKRKLGAAFRLPVSAIDRRGGGRCSGCPPA
ncbi:hypothetical protein [Chitinimonas koreensis]|uniref:hypothetical protein n=1 Tax=Chitinimonas koreensis TaxID=356302 RepID=UPI0016545328|nr:hypothetical protein [Chitinimonas koreensis]QNM98565.1 hypothetical protein H9L41_10275 [Chitinimonas koreensis]